MSDQPPAQAPPAGADFDDAPTFIDLKDAVEVTVSENAPDDDDGDVDMGDNTGGEASPAAAPEAAPVADVSKATFTSHSDAVYAVACHYDATTSRLTIASGGGDDRAYMHVLGTGGGQATIPLSHPHTDTVSCVALNAPYVDGDVSGASQKKLLAAGSYDGTVALYDAATGRIEATLEGPSDVEWLCFHPKGGTVLLAGSIADGTVWMYHLPSSKCLQVFVGHEDGGATAGAFTPDGKIALTAGGDGTVRVWAPKKGVCKHVFRLCEGGSGGLTCLAAGGGDDGQLVLAGGVGGNAYVVHIKGKKVVATLPHFDFPTQTVGGSGDDDQEVKDDRSVEAVGFAPLTNTAASHWCATAGVNGIVKIWDLGGTAARCQQCRQVCTPSADEGGEALPGATRLRWHPTLPYVAASYTDGTIKIWDARSGTAVGVPLTGHGDMINDMDVVFLPGKAVFVTGCDDKTVKLFEVDLA